MRPTGTGDKQPAVKHPVAPLTPEVRAQWLAVDYATLLQPADVAAIATQATDFFECLTSAWRDVYEELTPRPPNLCLIRLGTFLYLYDDYETLEQLGKVPVNRAFESRLVGVLGYSKPQKAERDDSRLKGWVGPTEKMFGREWDKGHFMAHSIGGAVNQWEINVFVQKRRLNRGWSAAGKQYRLMERYCFDHPGTLCFSRPLYGDGSATPVMLEFGLLKADGRWWVECFENY